MTTGDPEINRGADGIDWAWERHSSDNVFYYSLIQALHRHIPRGAVVLEIGVGSGHALAELNRSRDCLCYGVDILPSAATVARARAAHVGSDRASGGWFWV